MPVRDNPHPVAQRFGTRAQELRLERGLSLEKVARAAGTSRGHLSNIEHGHVIVTIETVFRIARGLGVSPRLLMAALDPRDARAELVELIERVPDEDLPRLGKRLAAAQERSKKPRA